MPDSITENENSSRCCDGKLGELWATAEECTRREPLKCTGLAFFAGVLFAVLPLGALAAALVRIGFSLFRPLLLLLGAWKIVEEIEKRQSRLP